MQKQALVVDDSRVARLTLNKLLSAQQFDVIEKASAEEALSYLEANEQIPDVIFMDVMMEGMDGLTATRHLKTMSRFATTPVVICTGNNSEASDDAALAAGAQSVLTKPPQQQALDLILASLPKRISSEPQEAKPSGQSQFDKILAAIEQKLLPKLRQESQQISQQIIDQQLSQQISAHVEGLRLTLAEQLSTQANSPSLVDSQQLVEGIVQQVIMEQLPARLEQSVAELNLSQQVAEALASGTHAWLAEQQQMLQKNLLVQLNSQIEQTTVNYLEQSIAAMVAPVVKLQVEKQLQQSGHDKELEQLANRVSQLNKTIMGLAAIILTLAVLMFV